MFSGKKQINDRITPLFTKRISVAPALFTYESSISVPLPTIEGEETICRRIRRRLLFMPHRNQEKRRFQQPPLLS